MRKTLILVLFVVLFCFSCKITNNSVVKYHLSIEIDGYLSEESLLRIKNKLPQEGDYEENEDLSFSFSRNEIIEENIAINFNFYLNRKLIEKEQVKESKENIYFKYELKMPNKEAVLFVTLCDYYEKDVYDFNEIYKYANKIVDINEVIVEFKLGYVNKVYEFKSEAEIELFKQMIKSKLISRCNKKDLEPLKYEECTITFVTEKPYYAKYHQCIFQGYHLDLFDYKNICDYSFKIETFDEMNDVYPYGRHDEYFIVENMFDIESLLNNSEHYYMCARQECNDNDDLWVDIIQLFRIESERYSLVDGYINEFKNMKMELIENPNLEPLFAIGYLDNIGEYEIIGSIYSEEIISIGQNYYKIIGNNNLAIYIE